jgi:hypothetical protein
LKKLSNACNFKPACCLLCLQTLLELLPDWHMADLVCMELGPGLAAPFGHSVRSPEIEQPAWVCAQFIDAYWLW